MYSTKLKIKGFNMKTLLWTLLFLSLLGQTGRSQSIEMHLTPGELPSLPQGMTYKEFKMLSHSITWQRLMIATFVPGYIHFYIEHRKAGYTIAGVRGAGFLLSAVGVLRQWRQTKEFNLNIFDNSETNFYIFFAGVLLNAAGYAFDIAHGDWLISKERMQIQFKYRRLLSPCCAGIPNESLPMVGINFSF